MSNLFKDKVTFNEDIVLWDTQKVIDMSNMFNGAANFSQNLSSWDVNLVEENSLFEVGSLLT